MPLEVHLLSSHCWATLVAAASVAGALVSNQAMVRGRRYIQAEKNCFIDCPSDCGKVHSGGCQTQMVVKHRAEILTTDTAIKPRKQISTQYRP